MPGPSGILRFAILIAALAVLPALSRAAPDEVVVRVETGTHLLRVENLFVDSMHGQIVSTSTEGAVRFRDSRTGALNKTIWLPSSGGDGLQKSGLARSGNLLGVGLSISGQYYFFLYNTGTDAAPVAHRLPNQVSAVAFSPDEKFVAVATWDTVRVFSLPEFRLVFLDKFRDVVWGLDYGPDGGFAAGSFAGEVRLYDPGNHVVAKTQAKAGREITDLRFSPDGSKIALGFNSGDGNEVLRVPDLTSASILVPPASAARPDEFARVAWADAGRTLLTSASEPDDTPGVRPHYSVVEWPIEADGRQLRKVLVAGRGVGDLLTLADVPFGDNGRSIAVGLWNGDVYRADKTGTIWRSAATKIYFDAEPPDRLLVSDDGSVVALDSQTPGHGFRLDLSSEQLTPGGDRRELNPPLHSSPLLGVTNAGDSEAIRINGRGPALGRWETISAWALGHNGDSVFLATRFRVIRLASSAEQVWATEPGPELWALNVTKDGRYVIAAAGDGTIRWFDGESGTQLLSIFVHADLRRWVAWAPDGHFTGSPESFALLRAFRAGETPLHLLSPIDQTTYEHDFHAADLLSHRFAQPR